MNDDFFPFPFQIFYSSSAQSILSDTHSLTLEWNSTADAETYTVLYGPLSAPQQENYTFAATAGQTSQAVLTSLVPGLLYKAQVFKTAAGTTTLLHDFTKATSKYILKLVSKFGNSKIFRCPIFLENAI